MQVNFYASYRQIAGCESCDIPAPENVLALLKDLVEKWPAFNGVILDEAGADKCGYVAIMVGGKFIEQLDGVATKLTEEDVVTITPLIAGG